MLQNGAAILVAPKRKVDCARTVPEKFIQAYMREWTGIGARPQAAANLSGRSGAISGGCRNALSNMLFGPFPVGQVDLNRAREAREDTENSEYAERDDGGQK